MDWRFNSPREALDDLVELFGEPTIKDYSPGGLALWLRRDLEDKFIYGIPCCFEEILIRDELVPHRCPSKHQDFLYSYILADIGPDLLPIIHSISGSIHYDPLKHLLGARCGSLEANIATLALATDILTDQVPFKVYKNGLAKMYGEMIKSTSDPENAEELYYRLCENLRILGKPTASDFWIGAFTSDCTDPNENFSFTAVCDKVDKAENRSKSNKKNDNKANKPQRNRDLDKADKPQRNGGKDKADKPQQSGGRDKADKPQRN